MTHRALRAGRRLPRLGSVDASPSPRPDGRDRRSPVLRVAAGVGVAALLVGILGLATGLGGPVAGALAFAVTTAVGAVVLVGCGVGWLMRRTGGTSGPFA